MSPYTNWYGLWCIVNQEFKSPVEIQKWSFDFFFLVLASYNNIDYKYESFFTLFTSWS